MAPACLGGYKITPLTQGQTAEGPQINDSGQVAWKGQGGQIFFYNGSSVVQLTYDNVGKKYPLLSEGGHIVWQSWDGRDEIMLFNGTEVIQLTNNGRPKDYLQINGSGIFCPGNSCQDFYPYGTDIILTATPESSASFAGWMPQSLGCGTSLTCLVPITKTWAGLCTIKAVFIGEGQ